MTTKIENKNKTGGEKRKKTTRMNRNRKTEKQKNRKKKMEPCFAQFLPKTIFILHSLPRDF